MSEEEPQIPEQSLEAQLIPEQLIPGQPAPEQLQSGELRVVETQITALSSDELEQVEARPVEPKPAMQRDLGVQPIAALMEQFHLKPHDLVIASTEQLTHKMVARAVKGRRLTSNSKRIVQRAFNKAAKGSFTFAQLFNY